MKASGPATSYKDNGMVKHWATSSGPIRITRASEYLESMQIQLSQVCEDTIGTVSGRSLA